MQNGESNMVVKRGAEESLLLGGVQLCPVKRDHAPLLDSVRHVLVIARRVILQDPPVPDSTGGPRRRQRDVGY